MPLSRDDFVQRYGGIYEHSAWVAEQCFDAARDVDKISDLIALFAKCVDSASADQKFALIRAHPDLAGKAAVAGELTHDSTDEQSSAGIDQCSREEFVQFQAMNEQYKERFSFPFIMAVRNSNREAILAAFKERLNNDADTEFVTAMNEIHKIARLRLQALDNE